MHHPTREEITQILGVINPRAPFGERNTGLLKLALNTGLRVSELVGLDVRHVSAGNCVARDTLHLPAEPAKGSRGRVIPLNKRARAAVVQVLLFNKKRGFSVAQDAPVFVNRKHKRLSVRAVQYLVEDLRKKAGLDVQITPHSMRHSFASRLAETGNLRVVQLACGHARLTTAEVYTHPTREEIAEHLERMD